MPIEKSITFTGLSKGQRYSQKAPLQCYLCKRRDGQQSMFIDNSDGKTKFNKITVNISKAEHKNVELEYPLCLECLLLLSKLEKII